MNQAGDNFPPTHDCAVERVRATRSINNARLGIGAFKNCIGEKRSGRALKPDAVDPSLSCERRVFRDLLYDVLALRTFKHP